MPGYPSSLFVAPPSRHLECSVCMEILKDPQQICSNGHSFCQACVQRLLNTKKCPTCREYISIRSCINNVVVRQVIDSLEVKCNSDVTQCCEWIGLLSARDNHIKRDCPFTMLNCSNQGCKAAMFRRDLTKHQTICPFQIIKCFHCSQRMLREKYAAHRPACPERSVLCTHQCGAWVRFSKLKEHHRKCPNISISCPLHQFQCCTKSTCTGFIVRKKLAAHVRDHVNLPDSTDRAVLKLINHNLYLETVIQVLSLHTTETEKSIGDSSEAVPVLLKWLDEFKRSENWAGIMKINEQLQRKSDMDGTVCITRHVVLDNVHAPTMPAGEVKPFTGVGDSRSKVTLVRTNNHFWICLPERDCAVLVAHPLGGKSFEIQKQSSCMVPVTEHCGKTYCCLVTMLLKPEDVDSVEKNEDIRQRLIVG